MNRSEISKHAIVAAVAVILMHSAGCGGDDDNGGGDDSTPTRTATSVPSQPNATATPNPTDTPVASATPTDVAGAAVRGFLVVDDAVQAGIGDALSLAPESEFISPGFDRSLSFADWTLQCEAEFDERQGTTDGSGRFVIGDVPPGECSLMVNKTVGGNLMSFVVPFSVGDDGASDVVAEVSWGRVRVTSSYTSGGEEVRRVTTNHGSRLLYRDGALREIADYARHLVDDDGDGMFTSLACSANLWQCEDFGECGDGGRCTCTASCPECDDCGPAVCAPPLPSNPYRCEVDDTCANPDDQCVCVSSSANARDCPQRVCVPICNPVAIDDVRVYGPDRLVVGQPASFGASAMLSDGGVIDVTGLADWASRQQEVLTVGAWGIGEAIAAGTAQVVASIESVSSEPFAVVVTARPQLRAIHLNNYECYPVPFHDLPPSAPVPELLDASFAPPFCSDAIEIGGEIQMRATGEFDGGYFEDITDEVEWSASPDGVVSINAGLLLGVGEGSASVSARLDGVTSEPREIRVVAERSVVSLNIYPESHSYFPIAVVDIEPCFEFVCPGSFTLLIDDETRFRATARFDIGGWEDVTESVTWVVENDSIVSFDDGGVMTAEAAGETSVHASLGDVDSHPYGVRVVAEATLQQLDVYQEGNGALDRVIEKGGQAFFHAQGYYDVGFGRDATDDVVWRTTDESVARFDEPGVLTGLSAGDVMIWAELDGVESSRQNFEVFEQSDVDFCDIENVNRGTWTDGFNRVYLESDCDAYTQPDVVEIRFTVTEQERPGGIFDPCLDLYAFRVDGEDETFVRTIREEGVWRALLGRGGA